MIFRCRWPLFVRPMAILRLHVIAMAPCPLPVWLHGLPVASWPRLAAICCNKNAARGIRSNKLAVRRLPNGPNAMAKRPLSLCETCRMAGRNVPSCHPMVPPASGMAISVIMFYRGPSVSPRPKPYLALSGAQPPRAHRAVWAARPCIVDGAADRAASFSRRLPYTSQKLLSAVKKPCHFFVIHSFCLNFAVKTDK